MIREGVLTQEQMEQFEKEGYLILESVFNENEVLRMREEADYILKLIINSSLANKRKSRRLDWMLMDGVQHVRKIQPINDLSLFLSQISEDERFTGPMRQIMGSDPVLMEEKLNYKQPLSKQVEGLEINSKDDRFPLHNDWAYFKAQNYPQEIISSAISMDACTANNGPLRVWPGSHKTHLEHVKGEFGLEVKEGLIDPEGGIDILAPAGSVMLFHSLLVHNSRPNMTDGPRRLMIYSHFPSSFKIGFDVRNGPTRLKESPYEEEYHRMKERGEYTDLF